MAVSEQDVQNIAKLIARARKAQAAAARRNR